MAKKSKSQHPLKRKYTVHRKLEEPVHSLWGYGVLFVLAVVVLYLVYSVKSI